jgi:ABC-type dipeptide/oligopeptide/nickel transport system permease component
VKIWWIQPLVRIIVALMLPFLVPLCITLLIWALPGDPAEIICPPSICTGGEELAARWNLDQGPISFYLHWVSSALVGDFGESWRVLTGKKVLELMLQTIPSTMLLIVFALLPITMGALLGAFQKPDKKWDPLLSLLGVIPVVVLALLASAVVELRFGGDSYEGIGFWSRIIAGALTLGIADGALTGAITGFRGLFSQENQQSYVGVAILRGEGTLSNTLPNLASSLVGQYRARIIQLLSGSVIVEVIVGIDGFGALLWRGTLMQDFGVVLAAATIFSFLSSILLVIHALLEVVQMLHIRKAPKLEAA